MSKPRTLVIAAFLAAASLAAGCGSSGTVADLEFVPVTSGYFDAGVVNGENKIVPSITFTLRNKGTAPVNTIQLNTHFQAEGADGTMDEVLTRAVGTDAIEPGAATPPITVRAKVGYTSLASRADMLTNNLFRDVRVRVFGKAGSEQWTLIHEFVVDRRILTQ